jgi:hypothetical protein
MDDSLFMKASSSFHFEIIFLELHEKRWPRFAARAGLANLFGCPSVFVQTQVAGGVIEFLCAVQR